MKFSGLINSSFNTGAATYKEISGAYVDGFWVENPSVGVQIQVSAQEPTGRALEMLPEGYNAADAKTFFTVHPVKINARIVYGGDEFKILGVNNWNDLGDYCEAVCLKVTV